MGERSQFVGYLLAAALVSNLPFEAIAQALEASQPSGACYEIIAGREATRVEGAILLNRCSGQTWILTRTHLAYRWSPIATAETQVATSPSPPPKIRVPKPADQSNAKCFAFQGRQYCE
jgi:hypothetical protein